MILDAEVLLIDTNSGKPLPFGTLGVHKVHESKDGQGRAPYKTRQLVSLGEALPISFWR